MKVLEELQSQTEDSGATQISKSQKLLSSPGLERQREGSRLSAGPAAAEGAVQQSGDLG